MMFGRGANAVAGAGLWFVGDAEQTRSVRSAGSSSRPMRVKHVERVEAPPLPVLDTRAVGVFGELCDSAIGCSDEQSVVGLVRGRKPFGRAIGEDFLQEGGGAPFVESGLVGEIRFENEGKSGAPCCDEKGDFG